MKITLSFPYNMKTFNSFKQFLKLIEQEKIAILDLPDSKNTSIIFFHHSVGGKIPDVVLYHLKIEKNMKVFCCYPETLPKDIRLRHIFPNGEGICSAFIPDNYGVDASTLELICNGRN